MSSEKSIKISARTKRTFISLEHVLRFLAYAKNLGIPVDSMLAFYNIDLRKDTPKPGYVPGHIWEMIIIVGVECCKRLGDELGGFNAAIGLGNSFLGLWSFIIEKSDTLGKAISIADTYKTLHADTLDIVTRHRPGYLDIIITPSFKNPDAYAHAADFYLVLLDKLIKHCTGEAHGVTESVHFQHAAPKTPDLLAQYRAVFNCPIYFNAPENLLRIPTNALNLPLVTADKLLQTTLEQRARDQLKTFAEDNKDFEAQARCILRTLIANGRASKEALAESLNINPRALLRKLQSTGITYQSLCHEVRLDLAQHYLTQPVLPLAFIANHLGFQDPQSFSRWFVNLTGESPSVYRNRHSPIIEL